MMFQLASASCLVSAVTIFFGLTANSAIAGPSVDQIIENYLQAIGGREALSQVRTMEISASYEEPAYELITATRILKKRPNLRVVELPELGIAEGFDGASWEYHGSKDEIIRTEGAAEAATRRGAEFDESVVDWKRKGHTAELTGSAEVFGSSTWEVRMTLADGWQKIYYFDKTTSLIVARKKAMPIHARGEKVETISRITDYRTVGKIRVPFLEAEYRTGSKEILNKLTVHDVRINIELSDSIFTPEAARDRLKSSRNSAAE